MSSIIHIKLKYKTFLLSLFLLLGCSSNIEKKELVGVYYFDVPDDEYVDSIYVNDNGTYESVKIINNKVINKTKGVWNFDSSVNWIYFYGKNKPVDSVHMVKGSGRAYRVKKNGEEIRFIYASEEGIHYRKLSNKR